MRIVPHGPETRLEPRRPAYGVAEAVIAVCVAAVNLSLLRGVDLTTLVFFCGPPGIALCLQRSPERHVRRMATVFLLLVAAGAVVAPFPALFPKLGGVDRRLPVEADRLLTWYGAAYSVCLLGILPTWAFLRSLVRHRRGEPAALSRPTCYVGLFATGLLWLMLPRLFAALGFWPSL